MSPQTFPFFAILDYFLKWHLLYAQKPSLTVRAGNSIIVYIVITKNEIEKESIGVLW
jgi:hypothetical protein